MDISTQPKTLRELLSNLIKIHMITINEISMKGGSLVNIKKNKNKSKNKSKKKNQKKKHVKPTKYKKTRKH